MRYVLPGMGATSAMFSGAWREYPDTRFLDWPDSLPDPTFESVALELVARHNIQQGDSLIGTSLGGMISLEIARKTGIRDVSLIASAVSPAEINRLALFLAPLSRSTPIDLIQSISGWSGELGKMFASVNPEFIRAMCLEVPKWRGFDLALFAPRRVHGRHDRVVPCPSNCELVLDGGHLIAMTHPEACARFALGVI